MARTRTGPPRGATGVEFLAPDPQRFGAGAAQASEHWEGDAPRFGDEPPRSGGSRWTRTLAITGVAAVLAVGVVAAEPWADDDRAAPPPTTEVRPDETVGGFQRSVGIGSGQVVDVDRSTTWTVDVPDGFTPIDGFAHPYPAPLGWFQLWTSNGATRTSGRWFAVHVAAANDILPVAGAERVEFGDGALLRWTSPDGVRQLQFSPAGGYEVRVTAFGWSREHLLGLAASMSVVDGRPYFRMPGPSPDELRVSRATGAFGLEQEYLGGDPWSFAEWRNAGGGRLALTVAPAQTDADIVGAYVVTASAGESQPTGPDVRRNVGVFAATVGQLPGAGDRNVVMWTVNDTSFSLAGHLAIDDLIEIAATIHKAESREWRDLEVEAHAASNVTLGAWTRAGSGDLEEGGSWSADLDVERGLLSLRMRSTRTMLEFPMGQLRAFATHDGVVVVAAVEQASGATALYGYVDDAVMSVFQIDDLVPAGDALVGAVVVEQLGSYRADLVDANSDLVFTISAESNPSTG